MLVVVTAGKKIKPGRGSLKRPVFRGERRAVGKLCYMAGWVAVVDLDPETEPFPGIDLTETMQGTAAGAVDHLFGATGLRAEIAGFGQGAVPAHAAAKEHGLEQVFTKGIQAAGLLIQINLETDCSGQGKNEALWCEYGVVDLPVDTKTCRW